MTLLREELASVGWCRGSPSAVSTLSLSLTVGGAQNTEHPLLAVALEGGAVGVYSDDGHVSAPPPAPVLDAG
jgi:hypothetical protein